MEQIRALYDALPAVRATPEGPYTFADEYRDFWTVFGTDAGRRVLSRIAQISEPEPITPNQVHDTNRIIFQAGMRYVMHEINRCFAGRGSRPTAQDVSNG